MQSVIRDTEPKAPDNLILVALLIYRSLKSGYSSISHEANVTLASSNLCMDFIIVLNGTRII